MIKGIITWCNASITDLYNSSIDDICEYYEIAKSIYNDEKG